MGCRLDIYNWPPVCISWGMKKWASGWILKIAFLETRDRWAPVKAFTISFLFAFPNGSNNSNRVNSHICLL